MKAVVLEKPRQFRLHDIAEPEKPGSGEVLVRVHRVGICGTDISGYLGKFPFFSYPRIPGHELGVEVVEVGSDVTNVQSGDRCSVEPYINNPASFASRRGRSNCCEELQVLGVHTDGGLRPYFIVPARKLHRSEHLAMEQLALVETLSIGCHAVNRCAPRAGENVLIIGAGPIGLSVLEFSRIAEASITVMDLNEKRLDFCRQTMGVKKTLQFKGDGTEEGRLRELNEGELPTVVFDATGNVESMSSCLNYAAHTGRVGWVGITTSEIHFPQPLMHARELTLLACRNSLPADFARIIGLIEGGQIDTAPWITHRTTFDTMIDEFETFTNPDNGVIKAIVEL